MVLYILTNFFIFQLHFPFVVDVVAAMIIFGSRIHLLVGDNTVVKVHMLEAEYLVFTVVFTQKVAFSSHGVRALHATSTDSINPWHPI